MLRVTGKVVAVLVGATLAMTAHAGAYEDLMAKLKADGATTASAQEGKAFWTKKFPSTEGGPDRSCATCHTENLKQTGKHASTGKVIDPLAPSANAKRLTDIREMEKWLSRNCKWVVGHECSAQEKANALAYIHEQ